MTAFAQLIGQQQAVELLDRAIAQNRVAPAYLFAGPEGVGRCIAAKYFVEQLFCSQVSESKQQQVRHRLQLGNHPDLLWVKPPVPEEKRKAAPVIRIEQIRQIEQFLSRPPLEAPRAVVVIETAEAMTEAAANALLKTLEEPGQATIVLIAPSTAALLPTLVSRCQRIPFYRLDSQSLAQVLQQVGYTQILTQPPILALAQGSPGEAIAAWQKLEAIPAELLEKLQQIPKSCHEALDLARQIDKTLDLEAQLWLVDYLQYCYWQNFLSGEIQHFPLEKLESTRRYLLGYAQPRLVWEVTLLGLTDVEMLPGMPLSV
jgi:DNA polymerase III subunit delta'